MKSQPKPQRPPCTICGKPLRRKTQRLYCRKSCAAKAYYLRHKYDALSRPPADYGIEE